MSSLIFSCNWEKVWCMQMKLQLRGLRYTQYHRKAKTIKHIRKHLMIFFKAHKGEYDVFWYNTCTLTNIDYLVYAEKIWN